MSIPRSRYSLALAKACIDAGLVVLSCFLAFYLRFEGHVQPSYVALGLRWLPVLVACRLGAIVAVTRYRLQWRSTGVGELIYIGIAIALGSFAFASLLYTRHVHAYGVSLLLLEAFLTINLMICVRVGTRVIVGYHARRLEGNDERCKRVLVVGAGAAGERIVRQMKEDVRANLLPIGFLDDDRSKAHRLIHGVPVLGNISDIKSVAAGREADQILIAIPSLSGAGIRDIVRACSGTRAELTILPSLPQLLATGYSTNGIRKVKVEDLLERSALRMDMDAIAAYTVGQRILVTGAGGSIGSELCRQIARLNPESLILLDNGENSLFWIEHELRNEHGFHAAMVIADIRDRHRLEEVFRKFRPTVVFHAAAHKHVPMMEANPGEAVKTNVFGTVNLAELSMEFGVHKFVFISTDKAVNPTSVMGTTKRVAEMVVQSLAQRIEAACAGVGPSQAWGFEAIRPDRVKTAFSAVRFGNVLGSNGSVIPTMERQIAKGGPVTVTHPEMTRYFMTIPEAVQLVIQAGGMGVGGELFVLDMGKPVRIMDLAWNLIRLSGLVPNVDIKIEIIGTRPGEKLYEELLTTEEGTNLTRHEKIRTAKASAIDHRTLGDELKRLWQAAHEGDPESIKDVLYALEPSYDRHGALRSAGVAPTALRKAKPAAGRGLLSQPVSGGD
ncbi:MAG TPA: nucleoside-diphosphate sugar epimerase/dehydratase [Armatimonadota bacterium]|jgi:FlaA1/EpsC-like NDP-sugar epimerase